MDYLNQIFVVVLIASFCLQVWLIHRHIHHIASHRSEVPEAFREKISLEAHQKAADYTIARNKFNYLELVFSYLLLLIWTLGGGLEYLDTLVRGLDFSQIVTGVGFIFLLMVISGLLDLPFSLYKTFVLEEKFGFNRTTVKTFIKDILTQFVISIIIGVPFLWLILWIMNDASPYWWLYVWASWFLFMLLMMWLYPTVIAPIFNKFSPLEDATLKEKITNLLTRCGFKSQGVFVMDGSKRSSHGNAYFTGFGSNKRIVFFDTLLDSLNADEIEAVLAHELGHFKCNHVKKRIFSTALIALAGLALLAWLIKQPEFYSELGVSTPSFYMALVLFMLISPVFGFFLNPVFSFFSRKHEFEADEFAAKNSTANNLISALVKLYKENSNTLTPDPVYSTFYDSHPPAPVRIAHLNKQV